MFSKQRNFPGEQKAWQDIGHEGRACAKLEEWNSMTGPWSDLVQPAMSHEEGVWLHMGRVGS